MLVTSLGLASCQQEKKSESKTSTSTKVIKKKSTKDKKKKTKTSSSKTESTTKQASTTKEQTTQSKTMTSQAPQAEKTKSSTPVKPAAQPTILDTLVGKNFVFSSGSGGWGARFLSDQMARFHVTIMILIWAQLDRAIQVVRFLKVRFLDNLQDPIKSVQRFMKST
ncbi:hypothetical protein [Enterococcus cecorum]|uniref:hypothetical protein n=1 Tax=Enterococcus cecorum TaxID=44008 RepID=UPI00209C2CDF|nr:hypothetical protein [Enterococcus cecorum]